MSSPRRNIPPDLAPESPPRPLWYLAPGGMPVPAGRKRVPAGVTHYAHEGDPQWTPIAADAPPVDPHRTTTLIPGVTR